MFATWVGVMLLLTWRTGVIEAQSDPTEVESCVTCHQALPDGPLSDPVTRYGDDVHSGKGFGCVACHGGDGTILGPEAMDPARGFLRDLSRQRIPTMCGHCHSDAAFMRQYNPGLRVDQEVEYQSSVHGQRLVQESDSLVATCVSCHPAHGIRPPSDPLSSVHPLNVAKTCSACHANAQYMADYGIPTDQAEKYGRSVHGEALTVARDLGAPTCNDCHGNHGAAPPGVSWVGNTCGQCHSVQEQHFETSRHGEIFPLIGIPGCAACHNNHEIQAASDEMIGVGEGGICAKCHTEESEGGIQALQIRRLIDSLRIQLDSSRALLESAENSGVEVSQAQYDLEAAHSALVESRAAVHTFRAGAVDSSVAAGLAITDQAFIRGMDALGELRFRRTGLAVFALITVVLIVALLLKIKEIEGPSMSYIMFTREMRLPETRGPGSSDRNDEESS